MIQMIDNSNRDKKSIAKNADLQSVLSLNTGDGGRVLTEHCRLRWHSTTAEKTAPTSSWPISSWQNVSLRHSSSRNVKVSLRNSAQNDTWLCTIWSITLCDTYCDINHYGTQRICFRSCTTRSCFTSCDLTSELSLSRELVSVRVAIGRTKSLICFTDMLWHIISYNRCHTRATELLFHLLPHEAMHSTASAWPMPSYSVCLSICLSVTFMYCIRTSKWVNIQVVSSFLNYSHHRIATSF